MLQGLSRSHSVPQNLGFNPNKVGTSAPSLSFGSARTKIPPWGRDFCPNPPNPRFFLPNPPGKARFLGMLREFGMCLWSRSAWSCWAPSTCGAASTPWGSGSRTTSRPRWESSARCCCRRYPRKHRECRNSQPEFPAGGAPGEFWGSQLRPGWSPGIGAFPCAGGWGMDPLGSQFLLGAVAGAGRVIPGRRGWDPSWDSLWDPGTAPGRESRPSKSCPDCSPRKWSGNGTPDKSQFQIPPG